MIKKDKSISIKCNKDILKGIVKEAIDQQSNYTFPASYLKYSIIRILNERNLFDYNAELENPILGRNDLMKINSILCELIVSGYIGINFFDKNFSGEDLELFKV